MWIFRRKTTAEKVWAALKDVGEKWATEKNLNALIEILNGEKGEKVASWRKNLSSLLKFAKPFVRKGNTTDTVVTTHFVEKYERPLSPSVIASKLNIKDDEAQKIYAALVQRRLI